ncbi:DUF3667 domain-containing protein [Luteibacter sp. CQ10]|uniref:DUF3667 domain-containing protein n=1 Tax=Luteibacter sp. CQ10 TaxID=2805821 RepID=UPI0034A39D0F
MKELEEAPVRFCANCGAALQGEFCHECGQSVHSVLRPVSHMLEDAGDIFFHMDERIVHTVPPLFTQPGFLTLEYFSGRRVRYIAPFRLMFVFCLLAFFFVHVAVNDMATRFPAIGDDTGAFAHAKTPDEVRQLYESNIENLRITEADADVPEQAKAGFRTARAAMRASADARLAELKAPPIAAAPDAGKGAATPAEKEAGRGKDDDSYYDANDDWLNSPSNVSFGWLPDAMGERLNHSIDRFKANLKQMSMGGDVGNEAVHRIVEGIFGVLPPTMFIMVPVFALILKLFYVFRRRLYMEHVIVALHSHAFLFLALLILMLLGFARSALQPHVAIAASGIRLVQWAIAIWMPAYLLLMQKRVYRQGWGMTIFKYWLIGSVYFWLLGFALVIAMLIGLSH